MKKQQLIMRICLILLQEMMTAHLLLEATDDYTLKITLTNPCPYFNEPDGISYLFPGIPEGCGKSGS